MYFTSMVQYMREQLWSICSKAFGSRVRSVRVVDRIRSSMETIDDSKQSCWAKMPPEMLTEILTRIEASESDWPSRKNVVSCAGVCRSWRKTMKEIVESPHLSGKLTFPISVKQPGLVGSSTKCGIYVDIDEQIYCLFLHQPKVKDRLKCLLAAKRVTYATCIEYIIFVHCEHVLGILRSNFLGTKFRLYAGNNPVSSISYALENRGLRQMQCELNIIPTNSLVLPSTLKLKDVKLVLKSKSSRWQSKLWRWCLKLIGRVTFGSIRNFELVVCLDNEADVKEDENILLQFKKAARGLYYMDYQYPISAMQAFAICLSTFDTKVACE